MSEAYVDRQPAALGGFPVPTFPGWPAAAFPEVATRRTLAAAGPRHAPLEAAVRCHAGPGVAGTVVEAGPFHRVLRLRLPGTARRRIVVLVPHSGYTAAVLSPVIAALLHLGEVDAID